MAGEDSSVTYASSLLQLLDLLDALFSKVGQIFNLKSPEALMEEVMAHNRDELDRVGGASADDIGGDYYCPDIDVISDGRLQLEGCGLMWKIAWCPILQGNDVTSAPGTKYVGFSQSFEHFSFWEIKIMLMWQCTNVTLYLICVPFSIVHMLFNCMYFFFKQIRPSNV